MENLNLILPEIFISLSIMFLLVLGVFKKNSSKLTFNLSLFVILITTIITINETYSINRVTLFNGGVVIDYMSTLMKIITLALILISCMCASQLENMPSSSMATKIFLGTLKSQH